MFMGYGFFMIIYFMGLRYLTRFGKLSEMKKIFRWVMAKRGKKRRVPGSGTEWMKNQIVQMKKMNQGVILMALGKD